MLFFRNQARGRTGIRQNEKETVNIDDVELETLIQEGGDDNKSEYEQHKNDSTSKQNRFMQTQTVFQGVRYQQHTGKI